MGGAHGTKLAFKSYLEATYRCVTWIAAHSWPSRDERRCYDERDNPAADQGRRLAIEWTAQL